MTSGSLSFDSPERLPSNRYFLAALLIHAAILFYPVKIAIGGLDVQPAVPVTVSLLETPPKILPLAPPEPLPKPVAKPVPDRARPQIRHQEVIAVTPENNSAPPTFSVAPPLPAPAVVAAAVPAAATANISTSPPSYDAAYLHNPKPAYPGLSRRLNEEGKVMLRVKVSAQGLPLSVEIAQGSGFERLDESARQAVNRWRFIPARRGDEAVEGTFNIPVVFRLDE
jgi:protein TonB